MPRDGRPRRCPDATASAPAEAQHEASTEGAPAKSCGLRQSARSLAPSPEALNRCHALPSVPDRLRLRTGWHCPYIDNPFDVLATVAATKAINTLWRAPSVGACAHNGRHAAGRGSAHVARAISASATTTGRCKSASRGAAARDARFPWIGGHRGQGTRRPRRRLRPA